jgi:hypothetical protein
VSRGVSHSVVGRPTTASQHRNGPPICPSNDIPSPQASSPLSDELAPRPVACARIHGAATGTRAVDPSSGYRARVKLCRSGAACQAPSRQLFPTDYGCNRCPRHSRCLAPSCLSAPWRWPRPPSSPAAALDYRVDPLGGPHAAPPVLRTAWRPCASTPTRLQAP